MLSRILAAFMTTSVMLIPTACTHSPFAAQQKVTTSLHSGKPQKLSSKSTKNKLENQSSAKHCISYKALGKQPPFWLKDQGIVVTRLLQECVTDEGLAGYDDQSPWVAMGFPCTGGRGEIEVQGSFYAPTLVSLKFTTDCPMLPPSTDLVEKAGRAALSLTTKAKLLAFNPFAVQYWEIPGLGDADVGFSVDLRSMEAKQRVWRQFSDKKIPIPVSLYGRENAWMSGYQFFQVDAELIFQNTKNFQVRILNVRHLDEGEIANIRQRCEALSPKRACHMVFS